MGKILEQNKWEKLATKWFPEHISKGDYKGIAMADQALCDNRVLSRFSSTREMARWLTDLLGWEVNYRHLSNAIVRFHTRDNNKEEDIRYLRFQEFFREESAE